MLMAERSAESTRALQEVFETKFLKTCNDAQTNADANAVNGFAHRLASAVSTTGSENTFELDGLIRARLAFDKANVPDVGRVMLVDPVCEATLNRLVTITHDVTEFGKMLLTEGMARGQRFVMSLYGWDIITSNRLDKGDFSDGTTAVTGAVANVGMCIADDQCKPIMAAWRRMPRVEGERNKDRGRDEFVVRTRYGFGVQRLDTLFIYITSATKI